MTLVWAVGAALGALAVATAIGVIWRMRTGRARRDGRELADIAASFGVLGADATLLQFSTEFCAPCRATSKALGALAADRAGISHVEVDLTDRPELAGRLNILQTPTTFVLDASGRSHARIGGAPRIGDLVETLAALVPSPEEFRAIA